MKPASANAPDYVFAMVRLRRWPWPPSRVFAGNPGRGRLNARDPRLCSPRRTPQQKKFAAYRQHRPHVPHVWQARRVPEGAAVSRIRGVAADANSPVHADQPKLVAVGVELPIVHPSASKRCSTWRPRRRAACASTAPDLSNLMEAVADMLQEAGILQTIV